jgi:hypothetical protein
MGVLHRDISIGNALICQRDDKSIDGRLIDLDYAKHTTDFIGPILSRIKDYPEFKNEQEDLSSTRVYYKKVFQGHDLPDDIVRVMDIMRDEVFVAQYARAILEYKPNLKETTMVRVLAIAYRTYLYLFSASTTRYWSA